MLILGFVKVIFTLQGWSIPQGLEIGNPSHFFLFKKIIGGMEWPPINPYLNSYVCSCLNSSGSNVDGGRWEADGGVQGGISGLNKIYFC